MMNTKIVKILVYIFLLIVIIAIVYVGINHYKKSPEIKTVDSVSTQSIKDAFPNITENDAKKISQDIIRTTIQKTPTYQYYTSNVEEADKKAKTYATEQKADAVIKKVDTQQVGNTTIYDNKYYAINENKKHDIKLGAANIDKKTYVEAAYRNRDIEYQVFYNTSNKNVGVGITYTIAKW